MFWKTSTMPLEGPTFMQHFSTSTLPCSSREHRALEIHRSNA